MDSLSFSQNWNNKLLGKYYTTVRLATAKYQPGKKLIVTLKNKFLHIAKIVDVKILMFDNINNYITGLDMGLSVEEGKAVFNKMYSNVDWSQQRLVLVLLKVTEEKLADEKIKE